MTPRLPYQALKTVGASPTSVTRICTASTPFPAPTTSPVDSRQEDQIAIMLTRRKTQNPIPPAELLCRCPDQRACCSAQGHAVPPLLLLLRCPTRRVSGVGSLPELLVKIFLSTISDLFAGRSSHVQFRSRLLSTSYWCQPLLLVLWRFALPILTLEVRALKELIRTSSRWCPPGKDALISASCSAASSACCVHN
jgi:hypothetical protein